MGLKVKATTAAKLLTIPVEDGSLIFIQDSPTIAFDIAGVRNLYTNIKNIVSSQKPSINLQGFYYCTDTNILWQYLDGDWIQITKSAYDEDGITYIKGNLSNKIVVSELGEGLFSIEGQYQIVPDGTVHMTSAKELFVCSTGGIHHINGNTIDKYTITDEGVSINHYLTSADMSTYITKSEAEELINELISSGVDEEVIKILSESVANKDDIDKILEN